MCLMFTFMYRVTNYLEKSLVKLAFSWIACSCRQAAVCSTSALLVPRHKSWCYSLLECLSETACEDVSFPPAGSPFFTYLRVGTV